MLIFEHSQYLFSNMSTYLQLERKRLGFSAADVVEKSGTSRATYTRWEAGSPIPSDKLALLAKLGFDVQYVITGQSNSGFNHSFHKRAIDILAKYLAISGRDLKHPEMFYPISMEIYKVIEKAESQGSEVDQTEIGAKIIPLFAA